MNLHYNKPRNLEHDPNLHAPHVSRILRCIGDRCNRTIVEYGRHIPETRHSRGLPEHVLELALQANAILVDAACIHHGGELYKHPTLTT